MCPTGSVTGALPQTLTGTTSGAGDAITPSCGFFPSADASFTFTAPSTDVFSFDTSGSAFNTVLTILDGGCAGPELACNDDAPTGSHSRVLAQLTRARRWWSSSTAPAARRARTRSPSTSSWRPRAR